MEWNKIKPKKKQTIWFAYGCILEQEGTNNKTKIQEVSIFSGQIIWLYILSDINKVDYGFIYIVFWDEWYI